MKKFCLFIFFISFCFCEMFQSVDPKIAFFIDKNNTKCASCGMDLAKFYKTNYILGDKQYASIHCLYKETKGQIPQNAKVVDAKNLVFIDANLAFYVVGSKIKGTMSKVSKYAFSNENDAKEFQKENGGEIVNFAKAYKIAGNDFKKSKKSKKVEIPNDARCPICGMFVAKNPTFATFIKTDDETFYFDGVKDLMKFYFKNNKKFEKIFVRDYYKLHAIDAKEAFFVVGSNVFGPMGEELIPFATQKDAQNFAKDHLGKNILKFDEIDESLVENL